jgi:hypothetical protein
MASSKEKAQEIINNWRNAKLKDVRFVFPNACPYCGYRLLTMRKDFHYRKQFDIHDIPCYDVYDSVDCERCKKGTMTVCRTVRYPDPCPTTSRIRVDSPYLPKSVTDSLPECQNFASK